MKNFTTSPIDSFLNIDLNVSERVIDALPSAGCAYAATNAFVNGVSCYWNVPHSCLLLYGANSVVIEHVFVLRSCQCVWDISDGVVLCVSDDTADVCCQKGTTTHRKPTQRCARASPPAFEAPTLAGGTDAIEN